MVLIFYLAMLDLGSIMLSRLAPQAHHPSGVVQPLAPAPLQGPLPAATCQQLWPRGPGWAKQMGFHVPHWSWSLWMLRARQPWVLKGALVPQSLGELTQHLYVSFDTCLWADAQDFCTLPQVCHLSKKRWCFHMAAQHEPKSVQALHLGLEVHRLPNPCVNPGVMELNGHYDVWGTFICEGQTHDEWRSSPTQLKMPHSQHTTYECNVIFDAVNEHSYKQHNSTHLNTQHNASIRSSNPHVEHILNYEIPQSRGEWWHQVKHDRIHCRTHPYNTHQLQAIICDESTHTYKLCGSYQIQHNTCLNLFGGDRSENK